MGIAIIQPAVFDIRLRDLVLMVVEGATSIVAVGFYLYALEKDEASRVVPLFQLIPVLAFVFGYLFLGEILTAPQLIGSAFIMTGALALSFGIAGGRLQFKTAVFFPMFLAGIIFALGSIVFKFVVVQESFLTTVFWQHVGIFLPAPFLLTLAPTYRHEFFRLLGHNRWFILGLNGFNEITTVIGIICFRLAMVMVPVALVQVVNGFQPVFVLFYGTLLTIFFPKVITERISRGHLFHKVLSVAVIFFGTYILYLL